MAARRIGCCLGTIVGLIVVSVILAVLFIYSGIYNVAATYPEKAPVEWVLHTTMEQSVKRHARGIKVPNLNDPSMVQEGLHHYQEDCAVCHGAPGVRIGEIGQGLNPKPPELTKTADDWKPGELFWITKHGVRMTGMPAWTDTHSDKEMWSIVAFMRKLPTMTPAEYKTLGRQMPPEEKHEH